jgi:uncharacterized membrane protein
LRTSSAAQAGELLPDWRVRKARRSLRAAHQKREAIARRDAGEALTDIARTFGVSHTTIGRLTAPSPSI